MNALGHAHRGPPLFDSDEARLRQLDTLIDETRRVERIEAERRAEEARRQAELDAGRSYTLAELEEKRAKLADEIAVRQTHLKTSEETELLRRRAERLRGDIEAIDGKRATAVSELAAISKKLGQ